MKFFEKFSTLKSMNLSKCAQLEYAILENIVQDGQQIKLGVLDNVSDVINGLKSKDYKILCKTLDFLENIGEYGTLNELEKSLKQRISSLENDQLWELFGQIIACLQLFVEINFTGRQELETLTSVKITDSIFQSISLDGENLFPAIKNLELFILAKSFFNSTLPKVSMFNSLAFKWWKFRCLWIHQQLIQEKSEMIFNEANVLLQNIELNDMNEKAKIGKCDFFPWPPFSFSLTINKIFFSEFNLEVATFFMNYFHINKIRDAVNEAFNIAGIKIEETGALGKRTKFQEKELAQLTLNIRNLKMDSTTNDMTEEILDDLPQDLKLDDEVRLDKIAFSEHRNLNILSDINSAVILVQFFLVKRSQPKDSLFKEELMPYLDAVLENKNTNWCIRLVALLGK